MTAPATKPAPAPPAFVLAQLVGGPLAGQRFKVKAGPVHLALTLRPKRGKADRPPVAVYAGDGATGRLEYRETIGSGGRDEIGLDTAIHN